jgi:hypothetical protein
MGHHDFVDHDDGTVAFLGLEFRDVPISESSYRMGSDTLSFGPDGMTDADPPARLFSMFDDFPLEPVFTCPHIQHAEDHHGEEDVLEWTHGNSLMYVPEEDAYFVNDKFTDWLLKIDRPSGDLVWKMNGRESDFTQPNGDPVWVKPEQTTLWSHGHMSDIWSGGGLMFDNGDHHVPPLSKAVEFAWDEATMTAEPTWEFAHPTGGFTSALGDVRRMPGDNVLITWAGLGEVTEVTRDQRIVWQGRMDPEQQIVGRLVPIENLYAP